MVMQVQYQYISRAEWWQWFGINEDTPYIALKYDESRRYDGNIKKIC
jgi:hypothetical protein